MATRNVNRSNAPSKHCGAFASQQAPSRSAVVFAECCKKVAAGEMSGDEAQAVWQAAVKQDAAEKMAAHAVTASR